MVLRVVQQMATPVVTLTSLGSVMLKVVEVVMSQLRGVQEVMLLLALVTFGTVVVEAVIVQDHNSLQVVVAVQAASPALILMQTLIRVAQEPRLEVDTVQVAVQEVHRLLVAPAIMLYLVQVVSLVVVRVGRKEPAVDMRPILDKLTMDLLSFAIHQSRGFRL